ncbi:hypothetical protein CH363_08620 [Leptospira haakeii]|uniref:Uncharacterized protein n=1 Tax=Leptospira haakeii TaxID=2023198 RepID=A0ABX4PKN4_9LEPT|nr:hypothetical protein CH363_08620 [Leptospira haakeii]PKA18494.1 hypothetical protein CH377_17505 [Leptospira haakeii]
MNIQSRLRNCNKSPTPGEGRITVFHKLPKTRFFTLRNKNSPEIPLKTNSKTFKNAKHIAFFEFLFSNQYI